MLIVIACAVLALLLFAMPCIALGYAVAALTRYALKP